MLLKIGNRIINRDHVVYAQYETDDPEELIVYLVNIHAGNERRSSQLVFRGDEARELWERLSFDSQDVMTKKGGKNPSLTL